MDPQPAICTEHQHGVGSCARSRVSRVEPMHVSTGDLIGGVVGRSAQNIDEAIQTGLDNLPCSLSFDEFHSVTQRRDDTPDEEARPCGLGYATCRS
jgi:SpoVK/Ycf46/Vps4 family AAA+-type ATPase